MDKWSGMMARVASRKAGGKKAGAGLATGSSQGGKKSKGLVYHKQPAWEYRQVLVNEMDGKAAMIGII
ncbi:hypothetical protein [Serratia fonticola]|uniref:hypothetical protein n=1 Tax=Serratia fonticola TaxID=47917 RepID=UPI0021BDE676|nr:hypothetical protein [Serratia fonticola]